MDLLFPASHRPAMFWHLEVHWPWWMHFRHDKDFAERPLLGDLKTPIREALDVMLARKRVTSSEIAEALGKNINIACNRLNALQRMGLVCRVKDASVQGGGRQFIYEAIL